MHKFSVNKVIRSYCIFWYIQKNKTSYTFVRLIMIIAMD